MASGSKNVVLSRRGTAISDLKSTTLLDGDLTMNDAANAGLYQVNCTHQVGIATATEVGLSPDRFPVRVVICAPTAVIPPRRVEVCSSYWRVTNAANENLVFSRRALQSELQIRNLRKFVPELDKKLWDAYNKIRGNNPTHTIEFPPEDASEGIYVLLSVVAPTANQIADLVRMVNAHIDVCVAVEDFPYFKIGENVYLRGEPHGVTHTAINTKSADRVALEETGVCMMVNHARLRARNNAASDGILTLASYTIAAMFRLGMYESYEHMEYYTAYVNLVEGTTDSYEIHKIDSPPGIADIVGLTVGERISLSTLKMSKLFIELANLMVVSSGMMHYLFNHTTGGTNVTGTLLTVLAMYNYISKETSDEEHKLITTILYESLHPTNKRAIADIFFSNSGVMTHGRDNNSPRYGEFALDAFTQIRKNPYPAGSHKAFICLTALKRVLQAGLAPFLPWADQLNECITMCSDVLKNGVRAHIGSHYYTGEPPLAQSSGLDNYLPELAMYVQTFNKGDSLSFSPHLQSNIALRSAMNWQNLLKEIKAKDISATSADMVKSFLATAGNVHFAFDPEDQSSWASAIDVANRAAKTIDNVFS